jgi:hypothetical protein
MKRVSIAVFGLLVLFASPALWAKGDMVLIEVKAKALSATRQDHRYEDSGIQRVGRSRSQRLRT